MAGRRPLSGAPRPRGSRSRARRRSRSSPTPALILLKIVAGAVTGSVAILTEAIHSRDRPDRLDRRLLLRPPGREPADADHRYGHEKFENVAAGDRGDADPRRLRRDRLRRDPPPDRRAPRSSRSASASPSSRSPPSVNLVVSQYLYRRARETDSAALDGDAAHLRTDAYTSLGVLVGLALVQVTGATWLDPVVALADRRRDRRHRPADRRRLLARARRRGAARRTRPPPIRDAIEALRRARRRRLPQAAHAPRRRAPLRRPARPVPRRHHARGRARASPTSCRTRSATASAAPTC